MFNTEIKSELCKEMSKNIYELRCALSLSQTALGEKVGISRQTISQIERGEYSMSWNQFASFELFFSLNKKSNEILIRKKLDMASLREHLDLSNVNLEISQ